MRYITVPEPFVVRHPITDEPMSPAGAVCSLEDAERVPFSQFVSALVTMASQGMQPPDPLTLIDIRAEARKLAAGQIWHCHDDWHKILADQCKSPRGMPSQTMLSAETHLRAVADAPSKLPAALLEREPPSPAS